MRDIPENGIAAGERGVKSNANGFSLIVDQSTGLLPIWTGHRMISFFAGS